MARTSGRDIASGLIITGIGTAFLVGALQYDFGVTQRLGPGYFPAVTGGIAVVLGILMLLPAFASTRSTDAIAWRPVLAVTAAIAGFALMIAPFGLIPAVALAVICGAAGDRSAKPLPTLLLAVVVALCAWLTFRVGLGLPMPAFRGIW